MAFKTHFQDSPGGPVDKTSGSQCRGPGFDPWSGNYIPHGFTNSYDTAKRSCMPQLKMPYAATKTRHNQIEKKRPTFIPLHPAWDVGVDWSLPGPLASSGFRRYPVGDGGWERRGDSSKPVLQTGHSPDQKPLLPGVVMVPQPHRAPGCMKELFRQLP